MANESAHSHWLLCPRCRSPLAPVAVQQLDNAQCPSCWADIEVFAFPALFRPIQDGAAAEAVLTEGESSCFYHPAKKAVVPCDGCGRFLCALCDVEFNGQHLCSSCIESGRKNQRHHQLENRRTRYDQVALGLTMLPVIFFCLWPVAILTSSAGIYVACRHWNTPSGLMVRGVKWRLGIAVVMGLLGLAGWGIMMYFMLRTGVR